MPKVGPLAVEGQHDAGTFPREEAAKEEVLEHPADAVEGARGRPIGSVQRGHGVIGAEDVRARVDQEQRLSPLPIG